MAKLFDILREHPNCTALSPVKVELPRLSTEEHPFIVELHYLSFKQIEDLRERGGGNDAIRIILLAAPELNDFTPTKEDVQNGITSAADLLAAKLLPGEIELLSKRIDLMNAYRGPLIVKEVKN